MKKIVVLTGAGVSAESGLKTFRDADGLWEGHDVMEVASVEGWQQNPALVLDFYNQRRAQLHNVKPNGAHMALVSLADQYDVVIVTQNVDDLHERAGSQNVIHLHGELTKIKSSKPGYAKSIPWVEDLNLGDLCEDGYQLRPDIVWFGEAVPNLEKGVREIHEADTVIIIGTSMQVYPAASLIMYAPEGIPIYYVDPRPHISQELMMMNNLEVIEAKAVEGVGKLVERLLE